MPASTPRHGEDNPVPTWNIRNFRPISDWMAGCFSRVTALTSDRVEVLEQILGPKHQTWVGGSDRYRHTIWRADADGVPVWVLASKRGLSFEMEHKGTPWDGTIPKTEIQKVLMFLAKLYLRMEEVAPVRKYGPVIGPEGDKVLATARAELDAENASNRPGPG